MTTTYTLVKGAKAETRELGSDNVISQRDSKDLAANTIVRNASKRRSVALGPSGTALEIISPKKNQADTSLVVTAMACLGPKAQRNPSPSSRLYQ